MGAGSSRRVGQVAPLAVLALAAEGAPAASRRPQPPAPPPSPPARESTTGVEVASLLGGAGDDRLTACAVLADGSVALGGSLDGQGVLLVLDPATWKEKGRAAVPGEVSDLVATPDAVYVATRDSTTKMDPACAKVLWTTPSGGRVDAAPDGGAFALSRLTVTRIDPKGAVVKTWDIPRDGECRGKHSADIAVHGATGRVIVCGNHGGSSRKSGNPVFVPWAFAYDFDGNKLWTMWNYTPTEVDEAGDMADTRANRVFAGADGALYMIGDSEGGNTPFSHSPKTHGGKLEKSVYEGSPFNEMWRAYSARKVSWVARLDPEKGEVVKATFLYGFREKQQPGEKTRKEVGYTLACDVAADESGRVHVVGNAQCRIPWTDDAVHKDVGPETFRNNYGHPTNPAEAFLVVLSSDLTKVEYASGFAQGDTDRYHSKAYAVAVRGGTAVVAGVAVTPAALPDAQGPEDASATAYLRDPLQPGYGGGKDGYFAVLSGKAPVTAGGPARPASSGRPAPAATARGPVAPQPGAPPEAAKPLTPATRSAPEWLVALRPALAPARSLMKERRFAEAAEVLKALMLRQKGEARQGVGRMLSAARAGEFMRRSAVTAAKSGARLEATVSGPAGTGSGAVTSVDEPGVSVSLRGVQALIGWREISDRDLMALASAATDASDPEVALELLSFAVDAGLASDAELLVRTLAAFDEEVGSAARELLKFTGEGAMASGR